MGLKNCLKGAALATAGLIAPITDAHAQQDTHIPHDMKQHLQEN